MKLIEKRFEKLENEYIKTRKKDTLLELEGLKVAIDEGLIKTDFTRNVTITGFASKKSAEKFLDYKASQQILKS